MNLLLTTQLLEFIIGVAALILLHELGHFVAARLLKVQVDEFGLGFPPRILRLFKAGGTEFTLNWIPLGGFVRPKGENDPTIEGGLAAASPWVRLGVLVAGPGTNLLIGLILGVILFYQMGKPIPDQVIIREVSPGSPAAQAGLLPGDLILKVNGVTIENQDQMRAIYFDKPGLPIKLELLREGQPLTVSVTPFLSEQEGRAIIGIVLDNPRQPIGLGEAFNQGVSATAQNIQGLLALPVRLAQGTASPEEGRLVGYKGMFEIYRQIPNPLWFFMAISISLGVINLMPFPALDGGRILLLLPEFFLRRRIPPRYENAINLVGFGLLLILLIYVNVQDFINPIQFPK